MPDDPEPDQPALQEGPVAGPGGFMVYVAVVLIGILIVLVIFMGVSGAGVTAATTITESQWSVQSITDRDGTTTPVLNGTRITAKFLPDGTLSGNGGCNQYSARYLVRETLIVVSQVITNERSCEGQGIMDQESRYYSALGQADALRIHDRTLTLFSTAGKPVLVFVPAPPES
jgi:heat shock protein HslJ